MKRKRETRERDPVIALRLLGVRFEAIFRWKETVEGGFWAFYGSPVPFPWRPLHCPLIKRETNEVLRSLEESYWQSVNDTFTPMLVLITPAKVEIFPKWNSHAENIQRCKIYHVLAKIQSSEHIRYLFLILSSTDAERKLLFKP